jgi:Mg2+-importing ATPase
MRPMRGSPSTALSTWLRSRPASCCVRGTRRAGASRFLPFLPLLANQIPRNKFLSDIPGMAIASDDVDREWIERPHRWDIAYTRNFMILFGLVSSVFDYLTFGVLRLLVSTLAVTALTLTIPYLPGSHLLGFIPLPLPLSGLVVGITVLCALSAEVAKRYFHAHFHPAGG